MAQKRKQRVRNKGKISLSRYFQNLEIGQKVAIAPERSLNFAFPDRFKGKVGIIEEKRGSAYLIKMKDGKMQKTVILRPIHLKKIN